MARVAVILAAAGSGSRAGHGLPKQYRALAGKPLIRWTVEALRRHPQIGDIVVVVDPALAAVAATLLDGTAAGPFVAGGSDRQASVLAGLESLAALAIPPDLVLIHDAARPSTSPATVDAVIAALERADGAIPALPVVDTLKQGGGGRITGTVPREGLFRAQTPQGFRFPAILEAHRLAAGRLLTDDAAVAEAAGLTVALVAGEEENFKVTSAQDLVRAERALLNRLPDIRTGQGFDVHALGAGDGVWLGGVKIPADLCLIGHSDADVALHALTDALLGAIGAGDIGQHFPPSDAQWRGVASSRFLAHAASLVAARGGAIAHVDLTIICERPKVGPHRAAMVQRIAEILSIGPERVSVKATTTERLGFTGRGEGIAAQAIATVRLP
uniref:bifunctional 2-C-methyl-D-erythritol 4-phosphate cytidylyltransferase/2-C-methyl-D-erythritol 2,4-cyclodiphosphate synthase n=1 Tax=Oleomonas cavernae TaxID=2320859 RepID=UPI0018F5F8A1|nr:bifunctional 2-C-methyl-D-erythritol 4-phosphate cytidylyltransferase/2-C-methyl-D-erythritol 2,4-cyclodiphosphate synthase [Oleomonas cavernae]